MEKGGERRMKEEKGRERGRRMHNPILLLIIGEEWRKRGEK